MPHYAQINDARRVVAVVETAGPIEAPHMVAINSLDETLLGTTYNAEAGTFDPPAPAPQVRRITKLAFRQRFTQAERVAIEIASLDDPAASAPARQQAAALRVYLADVNVATYIDLDRADTVAGVQALEAAGLLAAGRAAQVLEGAVQAAEVYGGAL